MQWDDSKWVDDDTNVSLDIDSKREKQDPFNRKGPAKDLEPCANTGGCW